MGCSAGENGCIVIPMWLDFEAQPYAASNRGARLRDSLTGHCAPAKFACQSIAEAYSSLTTYHEALLCFRQYGLVGI